MWRLRADRSFSCRDESKSSRVGGNMYNGEDTAVDGHIFHFYFQSLNFADFTSTLYLLYFGSEAHTGLSTFLHATDLLTGLHI